MDQKQRAAAYRLLAAIEANEITKDDASPYARSMDCLFLMGVVLSICTYPDFCERLLTSIAID